MRKHSPGPYHESNTLVMQLIWKEAQLHALWHEQKKTFITPNDRSELRGLLLRALILNVECQTWEDSLPSSWSCHIVPNSVDTRQHYATKWQKIVLEGRGAPGEIRTFSTLKRYCIWMSFRTSRMILLRDILEMLNWMFRIPESEQDAPSPHERMDSAQLLPAPRQNADNSTITSLTNLSLRIFYNSITMQLVGLIEEGCSAVFGNLTVPVDKKSPEDTMGVKGYNLIWPLGTMDSMLSSGLVPDSSASTVAASPSSRTSTPRRVRNVLHNTESPATTQHDSRHNSASPPHAPPQSPAGTTHKTPHSFDTTPRHPHDAPIALPSLDFETAAPHTMDVAAKREWLNSILYYIGTELGIKKALAVPITEGYIPVVKPRVDRALGK
jgi:hypothetical protein